MIVAKFGGSSVRNAEALLDCVKVVENTENISVVVISATYNTTNELEELFRLMREKNFGEAKTHWLSIQSRHRSMASDLSQNHLVQLEKLFQEIEKELEALSKRSLFEAAERDHILSFGERISSLLFSLSLKDKFPNREVILLSAEEVIKTDSSFGMAFPDRQSIYHNTRKLVDSDALFVTQGFLGGDQEGRRTTLGREGSDYSATLIAEAIGASEVHIWTDVDGVYAADPNLIETAKKIPELTYEEATILAKAGAKVLFPKTLNPLREQGIPLKVGKTKEPNTPGTWIKEECDHNSSLIGITLKERSDGQIITIVGSGVDDLDIEQSEIDRGELFRSFYHPGKENEELLKVWYQRYFL